jgi:hypothetical protein
MIKKYPIVQTSDLKRKPSTKVLDFILLYSKSVEVKSLKKEKVMFNLN